LVADQYPVALGSQKKRGEVEAGKTLPTATATTTAA
jgi:hypothetical protein